MVSSAKGHKGQITIMNDQLSEMNLLRTGYTKRYMRKLSSQERNVIIKCMGLIELSSVKGHISADEV